ncbi:unnamed protein product [Lupinus luteus]|uniref:Uncharacterized protein n=1 Tax=Lupinus luteus TaxID=3873 RepID=A0AAV1YLZ2_LUPLU
MPLTKFLLVVAIALWLSLSNFPFEAFCDVTPTCFNCSKCEYPCQQSSPPNPVSPSVENPPPPSGYSIYQAPPPPSPPQEKSHNKCPPGAAGVQCCTPPAPYIYAPPNPYTYVPYDEGQGSASTLEDELSF